MMNLVPKVPRRGEKGFTLIEMVIAMAIMSIVLACVAEGVETMAGTSTSMAQETQAIDTLQLAEQDIVRYVHAADCAAPNIPTCEFTVATATELEFTADINGQTPTVEFLITNNNTLTWSINGQAATVLVSYLDGTSAFTETAPSWTVGSPAVTYQYTTLIGVTLVYDSPTVSAKAVKTTVSDPTIVAWNMENDCQSAWNQDPGAGADPC